MAYELEGELDGELDVESASVILPDSLPLKLLSWKFLI